VFTDWREVTDN
jgi:Tfp pilus assembly protein PilF